MQIFKIDLNIFIHFNITHLLFTILCVHDFMFLILFMFYFVVFTITIQAYILFLSFKIETEIAKLFFKKNYSLFDFFKFAQYIVIKGNNIMMCDAHTVTEQRRRTAALFLFCSLLSFSAIFFSRVPQYFVFAI